MRQLSNTPIGTAKGGYGSEVEGTNSQGTRNEYQQLKVLFFGQTQLQYCGGYTTPIVNNMCLWPTG